MATYCTITDVNALVPQSPFTASTTPTQAQVENYIIQITNRLNACFENLGYLVPITGSDALLLVKEACAWGALGLAMQTRVTAIAPDQAVGLSVWTKMFNDWLDRLSDPKDPLQLRGAPRNAKDIIKPIGEQQLDPISASVDSGTAQDPTNYLIGPTFSMGMKF